VLGSTTVAATATVAAAGERTQVNAQGRAGLSINFVGMMYYVTRSDGSVLVALPGTHRLGHYAHVPFLMARAGSSIASALRMTRMPGVVPGAFDSRLADAPAGAFVFRCLEGLDLDVDAAGNAFAVDHRATHLAQMNRIAPGKRLRGDLRRWSLATVGLRGGRLDNAAAHPDAGKIWSFGNYQQPLTDATRYTVSAARITLSTGARVDRFIADRNNPAELWVVSSAGPRTDAPDPKRLEHSHILFEYLSGATTIVPTCDTAEGRIVPATDFPCASGTLASMRGGVAAAAPPFVDLCYGGGGCCD
jgi:hypothetical protein